MKNLKVVVIGGGSSYTPELVEGIINRIETLPVTELALVDVEAGLEKVRINTALVKRMFEKAGVNTKISYTLDRREALVGADYIMAQLRVGGLEARALDEKIPLKYGMVGQETTGMGGFFKALRTIPVMLEICEDIEEICPNAWLINFTNPSGIITEALLTKSKVKCIGLCNVPINMHYDAAAKLGYDPKDIKTNFIGLNHLSFMNSCKYHDEEVLDQVLETISEEDIVKNISKIDEAEELAKSLGLMLSPYMQYFYFETEMISKEQEELKNGEGSRAEQVMKVEADLFELYKNTELKEKPEELSKRGGSRYSEAAIALIHSIYNNTGDNQVVNTLNKGSISDLDNNVSVEVNCVIDSRGAHPVANGDLPMQVSALVKSVKIYEQYTIEAAIAGSREKALLALLNNPLVHNISEGMKAFDELLEAHGDYLKNFNQS